MGRVPLLETPTGVVFESNAIARYVARMRRDTDLAGRTFFESAQVDSWLDFSTTEVELPMSLIVYPILGIAEAREGVAAAAMADLRKALAVLERHLLAHTYLVGETVTLADVSLACALLYPFKLVLDAAARRDFPSVTRWFVTCVNQPAFKAVLGEVTLAEVVQAPGGAAKVSGGAAAAAKPEKKEKEAKPAAEAAAAAPKADKKKKKKDDDDDDDGEDEMAVFQEPKKQDPFAVLPASTMNLDEWKRTYSNSKVDYYASMTWFWEHLDTAGWTVYKQTYKYDAENKVDWQTSNLIGGFLQRCDEVRKYAFGAMAVLGDKAPFEVCGVWLIRGKELGLKVMLEANPDAEYYDWAVMDTSNAEARKLVADQWCALDKLNGKVIYDSKVRRKGGEGILLLHLSADF